jgi:hypothetical protein
MDNGTKAQFSRPPARMGPRPKTRRSLPYLQLDQWPPADILDELIRRSLTLPYVHHWESRMATRGTSAMRLSEEAAHGPIEAFIDDHEFCHIHPLPEGTIHMVLPAPFRNQVVNLGWAEPHPLAGGACPETLVVVYAPRNRDELDTVWTLIHTAYDFAQGLC